MSKNDTKFYIDGEWVEPAEPNLFDVINPATEEVAGQISLGTRKDVNHAVKAARRAFASYAATSREERLQLLRRIVKLYEEREGELSKAMTAEMGSPITFSHEVQTVNALNHFKEMINVLESYTFEHMMDTTMIRREPIGVCGLITPWNWPLNQVTSKLAPALAAGCTSVLKPSEIAPLSTILLAEILQEAGVPKGVFNLVNGDGPTVGQAISAHPDVDMVSFTGSTRAGILVAKAAAKTVKRVCQELGGKSPNIIMQGVDLDKVVPAGVQRCYTNTGQSCQAPTRMLVHRSQRDAAIALARKTAESVQIGDPLELRHADGPGRQQGAVRQDSVLDRKGHQGRRDAGLRRSGPTGGLQSRLFRAADGVRRCDAEDDDRQRGNLRSRSFDDDLWQRGRSGQDRQQHQLRSCRLRAGPFNRGRPPGRREGSRRPHLSQWCAVEQ